MDPPGCSYISGPGASTGTVAIRVEAERGAVDGAMVIATLDGEQCVVDPDWENLVGGVTLAITIEQDGDYVVWTRVRSMDTSDDSFFVFMDSVDELDFSTTRCHGPVWQWSRIDDVAGPHLYSLTAGVHQLRFTVREAFAYLDKVVVTDSLDPSGPPP